MIGLCSSWFPLAVQQPDMSSTHRRCVLTSWLLVVLTVFLCCAPFQIHAARLVEVGILDHDYLVVHFSDGDVVHAEGSTGEQIIRYSPELDTTSAIETGSWTITSAGDSNYGAGGASPISCARKTKLSGHAEMEWVGGDYRYEYTYEHWIYLRLPTSLQQGVTYNLEIAAATNTDDTSEELTFDIYSNRSEAIHVNLVGYAPGAAHKAADLYHWMGSGGARNYSGFEGNSVYVFDVNTQQATEVGAVSFWMSNGSDVFGRNLTKSDVWAVDFSSFTGPGTFRLVVEGVGCSQDFELTDDIYADPFKISVRGYFYMRIGERNPNNLSPPTRTPLFIPEESPASTRVYLTTMHPWHPQWDSFSSGDSWDRPNDWAPFRPTGNPTNADAWGGHSDAADWDRHLAHVANIYDMLLPFLLTDGAISDDATGITESDNTIPDIIDEARNEVDFWLRLRDGEGYSHGLTNPNSSNELFQAGSTAMAAWANAANAAMLADAFRVAGLTSLMDQYKNAAVIAYTFADDLADPMLDEGVGVDDGFIRGRDFKMMAAAHLYNVTGTVGYENVVNAESVCAGGSAELINDNNHQLWATAAYLITPRTVNYPALQVNMKTAVIAQAKSEETNHINNRPSRRATEAGNASFWQTAHAVDRTIVAHAVADNQSDIDLFRKALNLEADWGLGRNPANAIEMSTATTPLAAKRNYAEVYTSGRNDGVAGIHPGHTPYLNLSDWAPSMVMGRPSALYENSYPGNVPSTWPRGETYFPSRWVWAHTEFTPRQTMRGKMALYGYLYGLAGSTPPANPSLNVTNESIAGGTGTVTSTPAGINCGVDCTEDYPNGTSVILTATPAAGSRFTSWSGACLGDSPTCDLVMTFNRAVVATFEPIGLTYSLTVTTEGSGAGMVISTPAGIICPGDCSEAFLSGENVDLVSAADSGSIFTGWSGACSGIGSCSVTMNEARMVAATFRSNNVPQMMIYEDALASGWQDWSWDVIIDLAAVTPARPESSHVVNATMSGWGAFSPAMPAEEIDTFGYESLRFWVHGGSGSNKPLRFFSEGGGDSSNNIDFVAVANTWTEITISLDSLGNPESISRLNFMNNSASPIEMVSFDHIRLQSSSTSLFEDGFESGGTTGWPSVVP